MLREPASASDFQPKRPIIKDITPIDAPQATETIRELVEPYLAIDSENPVNFSNLAIEDQAILAQSNSKIVTTFHGYLKQEAELAYGAIDTILLPQNRFTLFRENSENPDTPHIIHIIEGRLEKTENQKIWINVVLFILTIFSVLFTGAQIAIGEISLTDPVLADEMGTTIQSILQELWRGAPYALSIMAILIAHEMGHYLMMRRHKLQASLPYFLPAWIISPFGTLGAAIMLREIPKNRKVLLDIGTAGPIAGFIVAIPLVIYGLSTSTIVPVSVGAYIEGNSLMYLFAKIVALGEIYPTSTSDVLINQLAFAGWTGFLLTSLQLIPLGQLDGGHILYSLLGDKARYAFYPVLVVLVGIALWFSQPAWLLFLVILFLIGRFYAIPLDAITRVDPLRRTIGIVALVILLLTFTPLPFYLSTETVSVSLNQWSMFITLGLIILPKLWRRRKDSPR